MPGLGHQVRSTSAASPRPLRDKAENRHTLMSAVSVANSPSAFCAKASAWLASLRLSLSALVSNTSSLTSPVATRCETKSSNCLSSGVKPWRLSTIITMPASALRCAR